MATLDSMTNTLRNSTESLTKAQLEQHRTALQALLRDYEFHIDRLSRQVSTSIQARRELDQYNRKMGEASAALADVTKTLDRLNNKQADASRTTVSLTDTIDDMESSVVKASEAVIGKGKSVDDLILSLAEEMSMLRMTSKEQDIYNFTKEYGSEATAAQREQVIRMISALHDERDAIRLAADQETQRARTAEQAGRDIQRAAEQAAKESQRQWELTHSYISGSFVDLMNNGGNAFDNIGRAFRTMVQRMVAEWAASGLMGMFGMGAPSGSSGVASTAMGGIFSGMGGGSGSTTGALGGSILGGAKTAGSQFLGGLTGGSMGTNAMVPTLASKAGAGLAALATNPLTWAVLGGAALATYLDKSTPSSNSGLLLHDVPGVSADRKFQVEPFESGLQPVGFARRQDASAANEVVDIFRAYDSALTQIALAAGLDPSAAAASLRGFDEKGSGTGVFFGSAAEDGRATGVPLSQQLDHYVRSYVEGMSGQVDSSIISGILSAGNADAMIKAAAEYAGIDGSHAMGLNRVPFDGYRAELHAGERVLTANQASQQDGMMHEIRELKNATIQLLSSIMISTKDSADILDRWEAIGQPEARA